MLPEVGSREREDLEQEALDYALAALHRHDGVISEALYETYIHFRERFIEQYGLMDSLPGFGERWREALTDARQLEAHVTQVWATAIAQAF